MTIIELLTNNANPNLKHVRFQPIESAMGHYKLFELPMRYKADISLFYDPISGYDYIYRSFAKEAEKILVKT